MADQATMMMIQAANGIAENRRAEFMMLYQGQKKERGTALALSFFLGHLGVDRFYLGQTGLGLLKLFTCGGLLVWWFVDLFIIMGATDRHNMKAIQQLRPMFPNAAELPPPGYGPPPQPFGGQPWGS